MANFFDQAKTQFSAIQGTVTDTLHNVKAEAGSSAGKVTEQLTGIFNKAPQEVDTATRDIQAQAEESVSAVGETAKTQGNKFVEYFAQLFEKCCAPFNKKKE